MKPCLEAAKITLDAVIYEGGDVLENLPEGQHVVLLAQDPSKIDGHEHYLVLRDRAGTISLMVGDRELVLSESLIHKTFLVNELMAYDPVIKRFSPLSVYEPMTLSYTAPPEAAAIFVATLLHETLTNHDFPKGSQVRGYGVPREFAEPLRHLTMIVPVGEGKPTVVIERPYYRDSFQLNPIYSEFEIRGRHDLNFRTGEIRGNSGGGGNLR